MEEKEEGNSAILASALGKVKLDITCHPDNMCEWYSRLRTKHLSDKSLLTMIPPLAPPQIIGSIMSLKPVESASSEELLRVI